MSNIPDAPTGIVVTSTNTVGTVLISWRNPSQIGIPAISNYTFTCSPSSGITFSSIVNVAFTRINAIGLVNGTTYVFSVSVVNSAGTSDPAYSKSFTYLSYPISPTSFSAVAGSSQVTLSWDPIITSGGLPITDYSITSIPATKPVRLTAGIFSTIITGLTNGTSYEFSITQNNLVGASEPSTVTVTPVSAPSAPRNITIVSSPVTSGSATISWTEPALTGGSEITGYTITSYPSSGISYSQPFTNPTNIYGLTLNSSYIFIVSAINEIGASPGAISSIYTYNKIPDAPTGVLISNSGGNVIVTWDPVVMSQGLPITGFVVISTPASITANVPIGTFSQTFNKLTPGISYTFTVYARNILGVSEGTTSSSITLTTTPGIATRIIVTNDILTGTNITWTDPVATGGLPVTSYTLASIPSGAIFTGSTLSDNIAITGLTQGTTYIFTVITNNSFGSSPMAVSAPFLYLSVPDSPTGVSVTAQSDSAIISWTYELSGGGTVITNYTITSTPPTTIATISPGISSYIFTGLTNGTEYTFNIVANNSFGGSLPTVTESVTPISNPGAPTRITAIAGNTSAIIQWTPPVLTGGLPITGYIVNTLTSGSAPVSTTVDNVSYTIITGLTNDTSYTFTVNAVNSNGESDDSAISAAVIPLSTLTVPAAPTGLSVTASSGSSSPSMLASFTAPTVTGGSRIINYEYSTDGGSTYTPCNPIVNRSPIPITTISSDGITPIVNGTTYTIRIRAINSVGAGEASSSVTATPTATIPNAPSIVSITPGNTSCSVAFTLSFNGGSSVTNYSYSTNGGTTFTVFSPSQTTSPLTISGLTNGTTYSIKIKAINSAGTSAASSATSVSLAATVPAAPTNLSSSNITASGFSIGFTSGSTGGSSITNYSFSTNGGTTFLAFSPAQTTSPVAITTQSSGAALVAGATYSVKIKEINAIGASAASDTISVTLTSSEESYDYPVITSATYDLAADQITIYFTPPTGIGEVTNYQYSTDGGMYSVLDLYPPQTTSPIVISNLSSWALFISRYSNEGPIGIGMGTIMDTYLQIIPRTNNTLCKASNTYKLTIPGSSSESLLTLPPGPTQGITMPGAPAYGPIRFNMPTQILTTHIGYKVDVLDPLAYTLSIANYAYTTDGGATQITLSPAQTDTLTIYTKSDGSSINSQTTVALYPVDSSGNIGTLSNTLYTFIPNTLSNPPEPPTLLSVNVDYQLKRLIINYSSNDVYNIYPILMYFYIGDSIINLASKTIAGTRIYSTNWALVPNSSMKYNNGVYTIDCDIQNTSGLGTTSLSIFTNQFKVKLFALNPSTTVFLNPINNNTFKNNSIIVSMPSNSITVSYSSYSPQITVNYSSAGLTIIMPNISNTWYNGLIFSVGGKGPAEATIEGGFLPFNVASYENTVNLSIDGGTTFISTPVTWTVAGPLLQYTFTEGTTYNLVIQILFIDVYGAECKTGNSNTLTFTYGVPSFSFVAVDIAHAIVNTDRFIHILSNGNLSDVNAVGSISNQTLSISTDGGTTFSDLDYQYIISSYNSNVSDLLSSIPSNLFTFNTYPIMDVSVTQGQTYSIVLKCVHSSGTFTSSPVSYTAPMLSTPAPGNYLLAINTMFSQSNAVYLSINTTFPLGFNISLNISSTAGSLGSSVTVSPVFSPLRGSQGNKLNVLKIPMSNFTPGTPSYVTIGTTGSPTYTTYGGGLSNQYTFTPYLVPNAPVITNITNSSAGNATIQFTAGSVDSTNNEPGGITNYLFSTDYFFTKTVCNVDNVTGNIIVALSPGTYSIQLQAVSAAGRSASSNSFTFTKT
jgi:hypothetical protein